MYSRMSNQCCEEVFAGAVQAIYYLIEAKIEQDPLITNKQAKHENVNLYKVLAKFSHLLHYSNNVKDAKFSMREIPVSYQALFI